MIINEVDVACVGTSSKADGNFESSSTPLTPRNVGDLRQNPGNSNLDIFTYEEMRLATKRFRPDLVLGEGGFGVVYKGVIDENVRPGYNTTQVAIKELNREGYQGDREWLVFHLSFIPPLPISCLFFYRTVTYLNLIEARLVS